MVGISVQMKAGFTKESCAITATGSVMHVITDKEANTFGLGGKNLKNAIEKYTGREPDQAYLRGPADGLYEEYNWQEVQIVLEAISATIIDVASEPVILETKTSKNNSKKKATFNMEITQSVETTAESNWSTTNTITIEQSIEYGIKFLGTGVSGTTSFGYSRAWGEGGSKSQAHTVGSTHGVTVDLDPGESALGELTASKGAIKARIVYQAKLIGYTAVHYHPRHEGHYYWCYNIVSVMEAAGIKNSEEFTEDIEIGFFGNSDVILTSNQDNVFGPDKSKNDKGEGDSMDTNGNSDVKQTTTKDNVSGPNKSKKDKGERDSVNVDVSIGSIRDYTHIILIATATGTINFKYYRKLCENTLTIK